MTDPEIHIPTLNGLRPIDHEPQLPRLMVHALVGGAFTGRRQGLLYGAVRLLDKALLAYDAAGRNVDTFITRSGDEFPLITLFRAFDEVDTCIDALFRAANHWNTLCQLERGGRFNVEPVDRERFRDLRNSLQHAEERVLTGGDDPENPGFLLLTDSELLIDDDRVSLSELTEALASLYSSIGNLLDSLADEVTKT
jgi:hypothetical protein